MGFTVKFPAIRGEQAGREFFETVVPFDLMSKVFRFNEDELELAVDDRIQRKLNQSRIPEIARYITDNDNWVFSAITASVHGQMRFIPTKESNDIGFLEVDLDATFIINDGQHRRAGILEALKLKPELGKEKLPVVLFRYEGPEQCRQMFADLNRHAVKPSKSINILFDNRDPYSGLVTECEKRVELLKGTIEKDKASLALKSPKLFMLSTVYETTKTLIGKDPEEGVDDDDLQTALEFWQELERTFPLWLEAKARKGIHPTDLRAEYVFPHGIAVVAMGAIANAARQHDPDNWLLYVRRLGEIDWRRVNKEEWEGVSMAAGRIIGNRTGQQMTTIFLKKKVGLPLTEREHSTWEEFEARRQAAATSKFNDDWGSTLPH